MARSVGQLPLNSLSLSQRPPDVASRAGLARLIRLACILREQGDAAGAARLQEEEVAVAVRDIRLAQGPEALPENELQAMFATEERRVTEAAILSELLLPRLVGCLPVASAPVRPVARPSPATAHSATPAAGPPAISDLLDAMLAAERTIRRSSATSKPES